MDFSSPISSSFNSDLLKKRKNSICLFPTYNKSERNLNQYPLTNMTDPKNVFLKLGSSKGFNLNADEKSLKEKKKFIFLKEIKKNIDMSNDETYLNNNSEKIELKNLNVKKIRLSKFASHTTTLKATTGSNSQNFTTIRSSERNSLNEDDFKKTIYYIHNLSHSGKNFKFSKNDISKNTINDKFKNTQKEISYSETLQNLELKFKKIPTLKIKISSTKILPKNLQHLNEKKSLNDLLSFDDDKIKIKSLEEFNKIQEKMQKRINNEIHKKGEYYVPNLKSLINVNNYLIRDFNIGGKSTINSKRKLSLTKQFNTHKENEIQKKVEKTNSLFKQHNEEVSTKKEKIYVEYEKQKNLKNQKDFEKIEINSKKICDLLLENTMQRYQTSEEEENDNLMKNRFLKKNLMRCIKVRDIVKNQAGGEDAQIIGFSNIDQFKKQKLQNDLEILSKMKKLGYPKFLKTVFKKRTNENFNQICGKNQGEGNLDRIFEKIKILH